MLKYELGRARGAHFHCFDHCCPVSGVENSVEIAYQAESKRHLLMLCAYVLLAGTETVTISRLSSHLLAGMQAKLSCVDAVFHSRCDVMIYPTAFI